MGMGCAHPTIHKFIQFLRTEQSLSENELERIIAGESAAKVANTEKSQTALVEIFKNYTNTNILKQLEGLSFNFDFYFLCSLI